MYVLPLQGFANLLEAVLKREYALYRAFCYYQKGGRRHINAGVGDQSSLPATHLQRPWRAADWMGIVPGWVWEELRRGQLDARQVWKCLCELKNEVSLWSLLMYMRSIALNVVDFFEKMVMFNEILVVISIQSVSV